MADGAVKFITDSIEAGDSNNATVRQLGVGTPSRPSPQLLGAAVGSACGARWGRGRIRND